MQKRACQPVSRVGSAPLESRVLVRHVVSLCLDGAYPSATIQPLKIVRSDLPRVGLKAHSSYRLNPIGSALVTQNIGSPTVLHLRGRFAHARLRVTFSRAPGSLHTFNRHHKCLDSKQSILFWEEFDRACDLTMEETAERSSDLPCRTT